MPVPRRLGIRGGARYAFRMPFSMTPLAVTAYTATSAMGSGLVAQLDALKRARGGLRPNDFGSAPLTCWIGRVDGVEDTALPAALAAWVQSA